MKTEPPLPLVTVVVIFLDEERFLGEAVASVFAQTYPRWELLLVDDGSSDRSAQVAAGWASRRPGAVRLLGHPGGANRGMSASRNLGLREAAGEYVAFLDADDAWEPGKLEEQVALLGGRPEAGMVYGRTLYWHGWTGRAEDAALDHAPALGVGGGSLLEPPSLVELFLRDGGAVPCLCSVLARREVVEEVRGFEDSFAGQYEDQVFYAKMGLRAPVLVSDDCSSRYRRHSGSSWYVTQETGQRHLARLIFLDWLSGYLTERMVHNREIWRLLREDRRLVRARVHLQERNWGRLPLDGLTLLWCHPRSLARAVLSRVGRPLEALFRGTPDGEAGLERPL